MGLFKKIWQAMSFSKQRARVLCVGLDNSGKTTILRHLTPKNAEVTPTVGFNVEEFSKNNLYFTCYDMSGQTRYRNLWEAYYKDTEGIIFVIDASEKIRINVVKDELIHLLEHPDVKGTPILFFANKMDIAGSLSDVECVKLLGLDQISNNSWHITASNALSGEGLEDGINWLANVVHDKTRKD